MPIASDTLACPQCGTVTKRLQRTVLIDEHDILGLLSIWSEDFDTIECRVLPASGPVIHRSSCA